MFMYIMDCLKRAADQKILQSNLPSRLHDEASKLLVGQFVATWSVYYDYFPLLVKMHEKFLEHIDNDSLRAILKLDIEKQTSYVLRLFKNSCHLAHYIEYEHPKDKQRIIRTLLRIQ